MTPNLFSVALESSTCHGRPGQDRIGEISSARNHRPSRSRRCHECFASRVAKEEDRFFRLCADFTVHVNDKIMTEDYPLHDIETLFHELEGSTFYVNVDLSSAYYQKCWMMQRRKFVSSAKRWVSSIYSDYLKE